MCNLSTSQEYGDKACQLSTIDIPLHGVVNALEAGERKTN
jgi:hypothetical protein